MPPGRTESDDATSYQGMSNPKDTNGFARVGLICGRFRDAPDDATIAAVATADGGAAHLTYGDLRELLTAAFDAGDRLKRIADWHFRETGSAGIIGDYCTECDRCWPCDTRRIADGTYTDGE